MFVVRKSPIVMGSHDRGFFCLERAAGRRSFVEDRVVRDIVELSTMSVGAGKAELVVVGQGREIFNVS